jgi:hypothetical protein
VYCKGQLVQLQRDLPSIEKAGYGLAAISYDSTDLLKDFAARKKITYPLLSDHDSAIINRYGVRDRRYRPGFQLDVDTKTIYPNAIGFVPVSGLSYPAVFVIAPDRTVKWRFVSQGEELRLTGAAILARSVGARIAAVETAAVAKRVNVTLTATNAVVGLGNVIDLGVTVEVPPGLHIYGPKVSGTYRGLTWAMGDSRKCWTAQDPVYPQAEMRNFPFEADSLPVYEGTVRLMREVLIEPVLKANDASVYKLFSEVCVDAASNIRLSGTLSFQACSDKQCFPPETVPLEWKLKFMPPDRERAPADLRREFEQ